MCAMTVLDVMPSISAVALVSRSRISRKATTCRWRSGSRSRAAMIRGSTELADVALVAGTSVTMPGSGTDTSRRRRRHRETFAFSAVRTTQAAGAGCLLTVRHDAHARAKASATNSCAVSWSPTLTRTVRRHSSADLR